MATFWYNVTPRKAIDATSIPSRVLFRYPWRLPYDTTQVNVDDGVSVSFDIGDEVWVKPTVPSCIKKWSRGRVTGLQSTHVICVDGMPRHVRDVRKAHSQINGTDLAEDCSSADDYDYGPYDVPEVTNVIGEQGEESGVENDPDHVHHDVTPAEGLRRSQRERRPPAWLSDYAA